MINEPIQAERKGSRTRPTLIFLLFLLVAPVLFVQYALYQGWLDDVERTTNHGQRMQPPVGLIQLNPAPESALLTQRRLAEAWWLMYIVPEDCNAGCESSLRQWAQVTDQLSVAQPVELLLAEPYERADAVQQWVSDSDRPVVVGVTPSAVNAALAGWTGTEPASQAGYFYLVNPQGSLMMNYPPMANDDESIMRMREDLEKLLRAPG